MLKKEDYIKINELNMLHIWVTMSPHCFKMIDDIEYLIYNEDDVGYLYHCGFVDTERVPEAEYRQFFVPLKNPEDQLYYISQKKMVEMGQFRYYQDVKKPFDPHKMRMGNYSIARFEQVFAKSILPSCGLPKEQLNKLKDDMISSIHGEEIIVDQVVVHKLAELLEKFPSPLRRLEIDVWNGIAESENEMFKYDGMSEQSSFTTSTDVKKKSAKNLQDILLKSSNEAGSKTVHDPNRQTTGEEFDIKSMMKRPAPRKF